VCAVPSALGVVCGRAGSPRGATSECEPYVNQAPPAGAAAVWAAPDTACAGYALHTAVALSPGEIIPADAVLVAPLAGASLPATVPSPVETRRPRDPSMKALEQEHIRRVLAEMGGNKRRAARALGRSRSPLDRRLEP